MINPFSPFFPAEGDIFASRSREQALFREGLEQGLSPQGPGPWNVALVGPWGIGKTSLLRRFVRIVREFESPVLPVALTVTPSVAAKLASEMLKRVKDEIDAVQATPRWPQRLVEELGKWEPTIGWGPVQATRRPRPTDPDPDLYRELRRLWQGYLNGRVPGLVFFLDDANALLSKDPEALMSLRGVFQDLQGDGARYPLVITGPEGMLTTARDASEPVTRFFERIPVRPFTLSDATDAIRDPMRAVGLPMEVTDAAAIEDIWEKTGGHGFFIAFAMRDIVREAMIRHVAEIDRDFVENLWPSIAEHLAKERFESDWAAASPAEQKILRTIADDPDGPLSRKIGKSGYALLGRMTVKGLVMRTKRGDYSLYHPLFQAFVREQEVPGDAEA